LQWPTPITLPPKHFWCLKVVGSSLPVTFILAFVVSRLDNLEKDSQIWQVLFLHQFIFMQKFIHMVAALAFLSLLPQNLLSQDTLVDGGWPGAGQFTPCAAISPNPLGDCYGVKCGPSDAYCIWVMYPNYDGIAYLTSTVDGWYSCWVVDDSNRLLLDTCLYIVANPVTNPSGQFLRGAFIPWCKLIVHTFIGDTMQALAKTGTGGNHLYSVPIVDFDTLCTTVGIVSPFQTETRTLYLIEDRFTLTPANALLPSKQYKVVTRKQ
jgi:hypothetical protein